MAGKDQKSGAHLFKQAHLFGTLWYWQVLVLLIDTLHGKRMYNGPGCWKCQSVFHIWLSTSSHQHVSLSFLNLSPHWTDISIHFNIINKTTKVETPHKRPLFKTTFRQTECCMCMSVIQVPLARDHPYFKTTFWLISWGCFTIYGNIAYPWYMISAQTSSMLVLQKFLTFCER